MSMQDDSPEYECLLRFRECVARRKRICFVRSMKNRRAAETMYVKKAIEETE